MRSSAVEHVGVLIFQDLAIVAMVLLVPILAGVSVSLGAFLLKALLVAGRVRLLGCLPPGPCCAR